MRRKFVEAAAGRSHSAAAHRMVALIGKLYAVERRLKDLSPEERKRERDVHSRPILDAIKTWLAPGASAAAPGAALPPPSLESAPGAPGLPSIPGHNDKAPRVLPQSLLGKAITYTLNLWPQLTIFLEDGHIPIDNNPAENAIRPFVVGRKNWLFSFSPNGARASATLYSLIESAKANGLEPRAYLAYLFERLPLAKTPEDIAALLPQNLSAADIWPEPVSL